MPADEPNHKAPLHTGQDAHVVPPADVRQHTVHDMLQHQISALFIGVRALTDQMSEIVVWKRRMDEQMIHAAHSVTELREDLNHHAKLIDERASRLEHRVDRISEGQANILGALQANTEITSQIRDVVTATQRVGRFAWMSAVFASKAVRVVGAIAIAIVGIWTFVETVARGSTSSFGVGP